MKSPHCPRWHSYQNWGIFCCGHGNIKTAADKIFRHLWVVIGQDPGEHRILHQVVVGASGQGVQMHQVLEVTDLSSLQNTNAHKHMLLSRVLYFKSEVRLTNSGSYLPSLSHWLLTNQCAEKSRSDTNQDREDDSFKQLSGLLLIIHSWFYVCRVIMLRLNYRGQNLLLIKMIWCEGGCTLVPRWCWVSGLKQTQSCQPARAPPPRTWKNQTPPINVFTAHRDSCNLTTTVIYRHYRERKKSFIWAATSILAKSFSSTEITTTDWITADHGSPVEPDYHWK